MYFFVFMLVLYCFCVATEFSVNKDLYIGVDEVNENSSNVNKQPTDVVTLKCSYVHILDMYSVAHLDCQA